MTMHIKVAGTWQEVTDPQIKVGGTWRAIQEGWVKVSGVWQQFFSAVSSLSAVASPETMDVPYGSGESNPVSGPFSVVATGGVPPYSYLWELGTTPTSDTTVVQGEGLVYPNTYGPYTFKCQVTDAASTVVQSNEVSVTFVPS